MSNYNYIISHNNTNKLPTPLIDLSKGAVNDNYSLTLFGSAATEYAEIFQENTLRLLENFAHTTPPRAPTEGQTWYDKTTRTLYVTTVVVPYSESTPEELEWQYINPPIVSETEPVGKRALWYKPSENKTYVFNGTQYEPVGLNYLERTGGTVNGLISTDYPLSLNIWTNTSHLLYNADVLNVTDFKVVDTSLTQRQFTNPVTFSTDNLTLKYPSVLFEVSTGDINIGYNTYGVEPLINFSDDIHIYRPLNVNNKKIIAGTSTATTGALTKAEYDVAVTQAITPGNYLPINGSLNVTGKVLTTQDFAVQTPTTVAFVEMRAINDVSSTRVNINNSSSSFATSGGVKSSLQFNGVPFIEYDSDTPDIINLRTTKILNLTTPVQPSDIATNSYLNTKIINSSATNIYSSRRPIAWAVFRPSDVGFTILNSFGISSITKSSNLQYVLRFTADVKAHMNKANLTSNRLAIMLSPLTHIHTTSDTAFGGWGDNQMDIVEATAYTNFTSITDPLVIISISEVQNDIFDPFNGCDDTYFVEDVIEVPAGATNPVAGTISVVIYDTQV